MPHQHTNTKKSTLWIILGIVWLNSIGYSIVLPLLPFLAAKYLSSQNVAAGMGLLLSVFAACTFVAAPVLGTLSDRYGRKPILIISLLGSFVGYVLFGIGGAFWVLLLSRIIDGLTAGNISTLFAYISDTVEPGKRTKWFGFMGSVMGIGKIGGPALGGLLGGLSISLPFYITAFLILTSAIAVFLFLPESLAKEHRTNQLSLNSLNSFAHMKSFFNAPITGFLLLAGIFFYAGLCIFQTNFTLYLKDVFAWGPVVIGSMLTVIGICEITSRGLLLPWLLKHFKDRTIGLTGLALLMTGLSFILASFYFRFPVLIILAMITLITGEGLFEPVYNGKLSQSVSESDQGKLQGVNISLQSASNMIIPLCTAGLYSYSPAILYLFAVLLIISAVFIFNRTVRIKSSL